MFTRKGYKLIFIILISAIILTFKISTGMSSEDKKNQARSLWQNMPEIKLSEECLHEEKMRDAYHEAGHALVAALNNVKIKQFSLNPDNKSNRGETTFIGIDKIEHKLMLALCGYLAEEIVFGLSSHGAFEDLDTAASCSIFMAPGKYLNPEKLTPAQLLKKFLDMTRELIQKNLNCLQAIAIAAEEKKILSGDEIYAIVKKFATKIN
jgi:ATP-dependent Zn protease